MISKHLNTLELPKILERLANHCAFSASIDLARALKPTSDAAEAQRRLAETTQAREALEKNDQLSVGGAHDVREAAGLAARGGMLEAKDLLDIRDTLNSGRIVQRALVRFAALYPQLTAITNAIEPLGNLVTDIGKTIDDNGEVRDTASDQLSGIRRQVRIVHDRLMTKLQRMVSDGNNSTYLQEAIVTQRGGRYVIPVKSDFKGRIPGLIHDQSASGLTLFIEPLATLELNNEWRELQMAEEREVRRILTALSATVGQFVDPIVRTVEALARFDLALAKAKYSEAIRGVPAALMNASGGQRDGDAIPTLEIMQGRHPLLNPDAVVPLDVSMNQDTKVLVITGPNTGGKTVALKTIGLFALMSQCGLHVPAQSARMPAFKQVYADIGDEQSIEQSLSTFSSHLTNLVSFFDKVDGGSLVLLDELGAGTDPVEGAAMARAMLEYLLRAGSVCAVATHYPELKAWAYLTGGVINASMAFDIQTLRPLYKLSMGLPGKSNAFAIAKRLNVPGEILDQAQTYIDANSVRAEDMLAEISKMQQQADRARESARRLRKEAEDNAERLRARLNAIEDERKQLLAGAKEDALKETESLRAEVRRLRARVAAAGGAMGEVRSLEKDADDLLVASAASAAAISVKPKDKDNDLLRKRAIKAGDTVRVRTLNATAIVSEVDGGEADVQMGRMRMRVKLSDLDRIRAAEPEPEAPPSIAYAKPESPGMELDLRGTRGEEGVAEMEDYLDRASRAALPFVRIIHGKGTGALRLAIRAALKKNSLVKSFETGLDGEGGDGVTVVKLVV